MSRAVAVVGGGLVVAGVASAAVAHSGLLDGSPPVLQVHGPDGTVRGPVEVTVTAADTSPGLQTVSVQLDDTPPTPLPVSASTGSWTLPLPPVEDGPHTLTVRATDGAWSPNHTVATATFTTDNTAPSFEWALLPAKPSQGEVAALYIRAAEPLPSPSFTGLDQQHPLQPVAEGVWRGLLGLGVNTPTGPQSLVVEVSDAPGNRSRCRVPITVAPTDFPFGGTIRLSTSQKAARNDTKALEQMRADRSSAYRFHDPTAHWSGSVVRPITGRRTSAFGRYRAYSDGRKSHHLGTDLANITGTPVKAALGGVVRAAGWQHLFGNAVIVHHGQGLTTSYNHLSRLDVAVGDAVAAGDVVGAVGSTGQSTGPHLHWGMQVGEVEVDPERWPEHGFAWPTVEQRLDWHPAPDCTAIE